MYLKKDNLFGETMSKYLQASGLRWLTWKNWIYNVHKLHNESKHADILQTDLKYQEKLHEMHEGCLVPPKCVLQTIFYIHKSIDKKQKSKKKKKTKMKFEWQRKKIEMRIWINNLFHQQLCILPIFSKFFRFCINKIETANENGSLTH